MVFPNNLDGTEDVFTIDSILNELDAKEDDSDVEDLSRDLDDEDT